MNEITAGYLGGFVLGGNTLGTFGGTSWNFDYTTNTITVGTDFLTSKNIVKNPDVIGYVKCKITLLNPIENFDSNISLQIVTDHQTNNALFGDTVEFQASQNIYYRLINTTGVEYTMSMFDSKGKLMKLKLEYS